MTTIHRGDVLDGYCHQAEREGVRDRLQIIVIPDRKSPRALYQQCKELESQGFQLSCPTLQEQDSYLGKLGVPRDFIPYDSDNRRNIGFLMALERGCDLLVSLDDDNYCVEGTTHVYQEYERVCQERITATAVHSSTGWFNLCDLLETTPRHLVYPRGFPYHKRHQNPQLTFQEESGLVRLLAGLWLKDPDLDAMTWLVAPVQVTAFRGRSLLLGQGTWSPINTQNTALHRDLIVCYYFIRMGYPLQGMTMDRYGDIFSGYLCQACVQHARHRIRVGTPVAQHRRNAHNHFLDLTAELACVQVLEEVTQWLPEVKLQGSDYAEAYLSLASRLDDQVERFKGFAWDDGARKFFHEMTAGMRQWVRVCRRLE